MLSLALVLSLSAVPETLRLAPGTQEVLKVPGVSKVALGNEDIADVRPTGKGELLLLGKQKGRTSLMLWTPSGILHRTIVVDDGSRTELERMVHDLVSPGLRVESYNGVTVIDGTLDSMEELARLRALVGSDSNVRILARMNPRVLPIVAEQISNAFRKQGLKDARATCVGQRIFLEGSVADEQELKKALLIADAYYGAATSSLTLH